MNSFWYIGGVEEPQIFFKSLIGFLPENSVICLQDAYFSGEIKEFIIHNSITPTTKIKSGTIISSPRGHDAHLPATDEILSKLSELSSRHKTFEIAVHLVIYKGQDIILEWHDAFANSITIYKSFISKDKLEEFNKINGSVIENEPSPKHEQLENIKTREDLVRFINNYPLKTFKEYELEWLFDKITHLSFEIDAKLSTMLTPYQSELKKSVKANKRRLYLLITGMILFIMAVILSQR